MRRAIPVRWALRGKRPEQHDDYQVLAVGPGWRDEAPLKNSIARLIPGTAKPSPPDHLAALPWVAFGPGVAGAEPALAVTITEWPDPEVRDGYGRAATVTRHFEVDFAAALIARVDYHALYGFAADVRLPVDGPLEMEPFHHAPVPVDLVDPEWSAGVAALLLDGPVVVSEGPRGLTERVMALEAVARFLPVGLRRDLVSATWVPTNAEHCARLAFGKGVARGGRIVRWGRPPHVSDGDGIAWAYLTHLRRLIAAGKVDRLCQELLREDGHHSFAAAHTALDVVGRLDRSYAVLVRARRGTASSTEIVDELRRARGDLDPAAREELLVALAGTGAPEDLLRAGRRWTDAVCEVVARRAATDGAGFLYAVAPHVDVATDLDTFLCRLVEATPAATRAFLPERIVTAFPAPEAGSCPRLRELILRDGNALGLVRSAAGDVSGTTANRPHDEAGNGLKAWVAWLRRGAPEPPPWVRAFAVAVDVEPVDSPSQVTCPDDMVVLLVTVAARHRRLPQVLPSVWHRIFHVTGTDPYAEGLVIRLLMSADLPPETRAFADVFLAGITDDVHPAVFTMSARERERWVEGVRDCVRRAEEADDALLRLVDALLRQTDVPERARRDVLAEVIGAAKRTGRTRFMVTLAERAAQDPELLGVLPRGLLVDVSPPLRSVVALLDFQEAARADIAPVALAERWVEAVTGAAAGDGGPAARCLAGLSEWPSADDPELMFALLEEFRRRLAKATREGAWGAYRDANEAVLAGRVGAGAARAYADYLESRGVVEARRWKELNALVRPPASRRWRPWAGQRAAGARVGEGTPKKTGRRKGVPDE